MHRLLIVRSTATVLFSALAWIGSETSAHAGGNITAVHPFHAVTGETVSVHEFDSAGAIEADTSGGAALSFRGLFLFVDAVDGSGLDLELALADADDPFRPLKHFVPGELIGPAEAYGENGDVIFTFPEGVPGFLGFRFSADGGASYRYGWVEFQWETRDEGGEIVDIFVVKRAAWTTAPGDTIQAGQVQAVSVAERLVQIRSVDIKHGIVELFNFGTTDQDLSGWQFCTHDENEFRRYTDPTGLNGVTVEVGTSLYIHFNNDAPTGDPDRIDRSRLGPPLAFATPLDVGPYGLQLYFPPVNFFDGTTMADHLQWNVLGEPVELAAERSDEAEAGGVWTNQLKWIVTRSDTDLLHLTDPAGGSLHGPGDYATIGPAPPPDTEMIVFFRGTITSGFDTHGTLGFGTGAALDGRSISGTLVYFPHAAPPDSNETVGVAHHLSLLPEPGNWLSLPRVKIDGATVPLPDFSLITPDPKDPVFNDDQSLIILLDDIDPISDGFSYNRIRFATDGVSEFADVTLQLDFRDSGALLHAANIAQPFVLADPLPILEANFLASMSTVEGFEIIVTGFTMTGLTVSLESLRIPGDSDGNGVVQLQDYDFFPDCVRGPGLVPLLPDAATCLSLFDFDDDDDVDLDDFRLFQAAFGSGA